MEAAVMRAFRRRAERRPRWPVWTAAASLAAGIVAGWRFDRPLPLAAVRAPKPVRRRVRPPAPKAEVATEFIPLPYGSAMPTLERPRVFRMRLPRTALLSVGLPMNAERAFEPVKADVVLDEDGTARAIRFIK